LKLLEGHNLTSNWRNPGRRKPNHGGNLSEIQPISDASNEKQMTQLELYSKLAEAISEIENGAKGEDAEKFIKGLMDC